jgi:uracil-DNA glycosylase
MLFACDAEKVFSPRRVCMTATSFVPTRHALPALSKAARKCRGCSLYQHATQTVFGEGKASARLVLIGEQPGDQEDQTGRPFVGPAGRLLDEALNDAGLERRDVYVTNAVKHFKWTPRGKRRLHKTPSARELAACRPWWEAELDAVAVRGIVCLGATAAKFVMGSAFRVSRERGTVFERDASPWVIATWHPSAVLRSPERASRERLRGELIADLKRARMRLDG